MQKVQNNQYDCYNDQDVNPIAGTREARTDVPAEKAEQPQDEQDNNDSPQHEISPFE